MLFRKFDSEGTQISMHNKYQKVENETKNSRWTLSYLLFPERWIQECLENSGCYFENLNLEGTQISMSNKYRNVENNTKNSVESFLISYFPNDKYERVFEKFRLLFRKFDCRRNRRSQISMHNKYRTVENETKNRVEPFLISSLVSRRIFADTLWIWSWHVSAGTLKTARTDL